MADQIPLLGDMGGASNYTTQSGNRATGRILSFFKVFRSGLIAPNATTYSSMVHLLNAEDEAERDRLTANWSHHKLEELNFIGVVGALIAGVLSSTPGWPTMMPSQDDAQPWFVRTMWLTGLVFALFSVLTAAQQSLRLHRLSAHRNGLSLIRGCIASKTGLDGITRPRNAQVFAWQAGVGFLTASVVCMVVGMAVFVWEASDFEGISRGVWDENAKLGVAFTILLVFTVIVFLATQASISADLQEDEIATQAPARDG
ncbi:uncharacterized protein BCR38DRAFT_427547 [Pseudomassariella vexata]|uniref:Uncharacterized protein n=1 Tax=Pseudomassariella vexata TaxID=1141098 RepID=A0A1Y2E7R1_9PEZI|nr:uncharacterized protein BCR38DRAFT_427547 [Pseudomassariella vexata]ORY67579.1 hypothetical protein BCR38DRAFT_427547 [Pseudomassariella vexata]